MAMLPPSPKKDPLDRLIILLPTTRPDCVGLLSLSCFRRADTLPPLAEPHTLYSYEAFIDALPHDSTLPSNCEAVFTIHIKDLKTPGASAARTLTFSDDPSFQHCLLQIRTWVENDWYNVDTITVQLSRPIVTVQVPGSEVSSGPLVPQESVHRESIDADYITLSDDSDSDGKEATNDIFEVQTEQAMDAVTKQGLMGQLLQANSLPAEDIPAFSRLFCLDEATVATDTEKRLPGTSKPLRLPQLAFLFRVIMGARREPSVHGHYLADAVGGGKTISTCARFVITRLAQLMRDHIDSHPHLHLPQAQVDDSTRCPLGDAFGIQCLCEPDNPLAHYQEHTARGFDLQVVPKSLEGGWCREFKAYVHTSIQEPDHPLYGHTLLHGYTIGDGNVLVPIHSASPRRDIKHLRTQVTLKLDEAVYATAKKREILVNVDQFVSKVAEPLNEPPYAHTATSRKIGESTVVIATREKLSRDWSSSAQSSPWSGPLVNVYVRPNNPLATNLNRRSIKSPALISPRSIGVDEYHLCYGRDNNINETIRAICRRTQPDSQPRPRVFFISGTPLQKQAVDLCPTYDIIETDPAKFKAFEHAMKMISREQNRASGVQHDTQVLDVVVAGARLISPWMTARDLGSPILAGSKIGRRLAPYTLLSLSFSTPGQWHAEYGNLVQSARVELQSRVDNNPLNPVTFEGFNKLGSITLLMRGAHCPGLWALLRSNPNFPWRSQQVWVDMKRDEDSLYIRHVDDYVREDPMFARLSTIIRDASSGTVHHGGKTFSDQGPLHILLFASFPATAAAAYAFLKVKCASFADVTLLAAGQSPGDRDVIIGRLAGKASGCSLTKSMVLVTTFAALGAGVNNLVFCNIMIKFGEPWVPSTTHQAIGRLHREGQSRPVYVFDLFRSDNDAEAVIRARNRQRGAVLGQTLARNSLLMNLQLDIADN
ncbi:hypothetical protein FDECE_720 [Fusarium decemcellulare]|nr:hypothetical protein FDECE_720 [Fusarium decemcellulare]